MARALLCLAGLLLAACCARPAQAKIEYAHVFRDDRPLIALTNPFGFGSRGHIDITLRDITLWRRHDQVDDKYNLANFGLFLYPGDQQLALQQELLAGKCVLRDRDLRLFGFDDAKVQGVISGKSPNVTFHVDVKDGGGLFTLFFASCEPVTPVSFAARVEAYNLVGPAGRRDYLSVGETELDVAYWILFGLFGAIAAAWGWLCWRGPREAVHKIHWLMAALVAFKAATLLAQAVLTNVVESQGSPHGWNWVYYFFTACRGLLFFSVVVLIGTGWSYMKPFIDDRTRRVLLTVIPLQVFANLAIIITSEESPAIPDFLTWVDVFHILDILCCCAILFPIVWSIKQLRDASETDGKAARCLEKLRLFRQFYVIVVLFVYATRILVYLLEASVNYRYRWVATAVGELIALAFYVTVGVMFRPGADNPYTKLSHAEEVEMGL